MRLTVFVIVALLVAAAGCGGSAGAPRGDGTVATSVSAQSVCDDALDGRTVTADATTLGTVRTTNIGGPYPGLIPGKGALPDLPDNEPAAWCWTAAASPSPGDEGREWSLYVAVPGGRSQRIFTLGGITSPPSGPPSIP